MLYEFKKKIIFSSFVIILFCVSDMFGSGSPTGSTSYYGTHTYNNTASLHTAATSPSITSPLHTIEITPGVGTLDIEVSPSLQIQTGFASWTGGGPYFDASTLGSFTLLSAGTGYINTSPVPNSTPYSWSAPQTVTGLTAGNTYYIYIDSTGTLQATTTDSNSLRENNVVLFEVLRDSTSPTNIQYVVKENNSFRMPVATYEYLNNNVGAIIENHNNGANIVLNGTQKIQINGADVLDDSGLLTTIPDSAGVGVTWNQMFTNAGGKWATSTTSDTFTGQWNNLGTVTSLSAGQYAVYTLYVAKDNLNSSAPQYFAVLNVAQYPSLVAANAAITAGSISRATVELAALELAQLGYIIYSQTSNSIASVQIQKTTLGSSISTGGTTNASLIITNTATFDGILSAADTNVQAALETIDEWGKNATNHGVLIGRGVNTPISAVASVSPSGIPLVSQGAGVDPAYTTAVVAGGGTGVATMTTAYAPVISGTTPTGALQVASTGLATAGFILTSNGAAAVPSFQSVASVGALTTLTGDTGGAISPTAGNINLLGSHGINTSGAGSTITTAVNNTLTLGDLSAVATGSPSLTLTTGDLTITSGNINLPTTSAAGADGVVNVNSTRFMHSFGTNNSFVGSGAGNFTLTGTASTGIGTNALTLLSSGLNNTAVGASAGSALTSTGNNTAVGANALAAASGADCTAVGYNALLVNTAAQNTAVGSGALDANTTGTPNTAVGYNALGAMISGTNNVAIGPNALAVKTSGASNVAIGNTALGAAGASVTNSVAIGSDALRSSTGTGNVSIGVNSMFQTISGSNNVAVGREALFVNGSGSGNVAIGDRALNATDTSNNVAVGRQALERNFSGTRLVGIGYKALNASGVSDNTAVGYQALLVNTATQNTAVGASALDANVGGTPNTAVGYNALGANVSGNNNTAIGASAGLAVLTGNNTAVGTSALAAASGADSTAVGYQAMTVNTAGQNTAVGSQAMATNSSGTLNTAVGYKASNLNQTGIQNTAVGYQALLNNITNNNTGVGAQALQSTTSGDNNTAVGFAALFTNQTGTNNTAIGDHAFYFNTASNNTGLGSTAGQQNSTGTRNTAIGHAALFTNETSADNSALGYLALNLNTAAQNTAVGSQALATNSLGTSNTAVGYKALFVNSTGNNNTAVGASAGLAVLSGNNTAVGTSALAAASGADSTAVGYNALLVNTGTQNTAVGSGALDANTSGTPNAALGYQALTTNITGSNLVAVGANALRDSTGNQNTAVGSNAGLVTTGADNVYVGYNAGSAATTGNNNIAIGSGAALSAVGNSNQIVIGNSSNTTAYLFGIPGAIASSNLVTTTGTTTGRLGTIASTANSGIPLIAQGSGVSPVYGTATVPGGGTGLTTLTAYTLLAGGTTATGNLQQVAAGTSGQVLKSNGSAALPTWVDGLVQTATVTLTTSNVTSLHTTPIEIIAAPGVSGKVIYVINAFIKNNFVTTAFSSATGTIDLIYAGGSANPIITGLGSNAFVTAGAINVMGGLNGGQTNTTYTSLNNIAVQVLNPGAAFTGGGTSTITVAVNYVILTI